LPLTVCPGPPELQALAPTVSHLELTSTAHSSLVIPIDQLPQVVPPIQQVVALPLTRTITRLVAPLFQLCRHLASPLPVVPVADLAGFQVSLVE